MTTKLFTLILTLGSFIGVAQTQDTVIINLAKKSQVVITIGDKEDLEVLRHYDFQQLFKDVLKKVEAKRNDLENSLKREKPDTEVDSVKVASKNPTEHNTEGTDEESEDSNDIKVEVDIDIEHNEKPSDGRHNEGDNKNKDTDNDNEGEAEWTRSVRNWNDTWQTFNFDLGTNNFLESNTIPNGNELYRVRPWGSWYLGLASVQRSKLARKFFLEWGLGLSWYNFKFQEDNVLIEKSENGIQFTEDTRDVDFIKSKLSISYVHASLIPVIDFGGHRRKPKIWDGPRNQSFRIGFGPYVGYRIASRSKLVYHEGGRERDKNRDGFYLNNLRYGARLQIGYRSTDLFFNYDINELFQANKGPKLNAFSFGVIF